MFCMEIARKRRLTAMARGFFLLSHPGPVLFHIVAVTIFALLAAWPTFVWSTIALVVAAHAAMQISIAMLNDYCDRKADAQVKKTKPIPLGLVRPREALVAGLAMIVLMVLLLLPLNPLGLLVSLIYLALGQAYNLGLKSTPLSGVMFALAIPLVPVYAYVAQGRTLPMLFWLIPVGALLGIALNLANSLPDIEEDAEAGAHTLAVVLGIRRTLLACPILIALSAIIIASLTGLHIVEAQLWILVPTLVLALLACGAMLLFRQAGQAGGKPEIRKRYFYLVVFTCLVLAGGWFMGVIGAMGATF
ncbi:MAG TPA: UbiA family prenyltransferase [Ktedonobacteraceae bacterium]|nr:UbiA family prenyltransferase [Ktedonobacteraceae bacterium]